MMNRLKALRHRIWLAWWRTRPIQNNKIILWSDNFKSFGCSPKYIALYLAEHDPGKYDIVWVLERGRKVPEGLPEGIRIVRYFSMEYLKEIATAKVIVCNHRTGDYHFFNKRKGQYYIQTWHSSLRLKKIEADAPALSDAYARHAKADSQKIDLLISGCAFSTDIFRRAFWYDGEIKECGTPRCDGFFTETAAVREKVYRFFNIPQGKKLALYAPTFRAGDNSDLYGMNLKDLGAALGEDWVVGCRLHPNLNAEVPADACIPMSTYPDMQELLIACEMLITDYSSSMFDMGVAGKKCVLFVPDLEEYTSKERGLYFDIHQLPFPKCYDMSQLCDTVRCFDEKAYTQNVREFINKIGSFEDGNAAGRIARRIQEITEA